MKPPKNDKTRKAWLASLKDGDEVAVITERRTKIVKLHRSSRYPNELRADGECFTVASGKYPGEDRWLIPATDDLKASVVRDDLIRCARLRMCAVGFEPWSTRNVKATDDQAIACAAIMWPEEFGARK